MGHLERTPRERMIGHLLAGDFAKLDGETGDLVSLLVSRGAAMSWHKHGTFLDHLTGTFRILKLWSQPRETCLCGLFHSIYSNEYVDLALFDVRSERHVLAQRAGAETERLVHLFCTMPRTAFVAQLLEPDRVLNEGMTLGDGQGATWRLSREEVRAFLAVTIADLAEQWYGWQDEVMRGYPFTEEDRHAADHWREVLWPGRQRVTSSTWSLLSRLARRLPELGGEIPPIFDGCTATLPREAEETAAAAYWRVANDPDTLSGMDEAWDLLDVGERANPWMPEIPILKAQLDLTAGRYERAEESASKGLRLLLAWGTSTDKRVPWPAWVAWTRVLLTHARAREWPRTVRGHNNLGLVDTARTMC